MEKKVAACLMTRKGPHNEELDRPALRAPGCRCVGIATQTKKGGGLTRACRRLVNRPHPMVDVGAYLKRIDYGGPTRPTIATFRALHRAHLLAVPFENLDIHLGRPIVLDPAALFRKIVQQRRGGFCYELNGLFAILLAELGFTVRLLSARVARERGDFGPEFDHLVLLVQLTERWLADVGFGDHFRSPLHLDERREQVDGRRTYRLTRRRGGLTLWEREGAGAWEAQYVFTLRARRMADFAAMCRYHQTSPESLFTRKRICSRSTPGGRVTLSDMRLIMTEEGTRREVPLSEAEYTAALDTHFGILLS